MFEQSLRMIVPPIRIPIKDCQYKNIPRGYFIGVLMIRESCDFGVYVRGPIVFVNPSV